MNASAEQNQLALIREGLAHLDNQQRDKALEIYDRLATQDIRIPNIAHGFGLLSLKLGFFSNAIEFLTRALAPQPANPVILDQLGVACMLDKRYRDAKLFFNRAIKTNPDFVSSWINLGTLYTEQQLYPESVQCYKKAKALDPDNAVILTNLAIANKMTNHADEALKDAERAIVLNPQLFQAYEVLGNIYAQLGDNAKATDSYMECIRLKPEFGHAYSGLKQIKKFSTDDLSFLQQCESVLQRGLDPENYAAICYCLGKAYDDLKQWDKAFAFYKRGNALRKLANPVLPPRDTFRLLTQWCRKHRQITDGINVSEQPVFVLGMPRSGSTLIDQIIASHPDADSAGELGTFVNSVANAIFTPSRQSLKEIEAHCSRETLKNYADLYLQELQQGRSAAKRIVDKTPVNFMYVGLIRLLFPNARFIHTVRDPLDTCLSCYFQMFNQIPWADDLASIAETYNFYRECMSYWHREFPGLIVDVHYEQLTANPEAESRRLLEACGLQWNPICLEYFKQQNRVLTASLWQVRQPIYQSSKQRWIHYAAHLEPLAKGIAAYLSDADREILRKHHIRVGTGTGFSGLIANLRGR